jgi:hypothetical protein
MLIDPALLSPFSMFFGGLIGGSASLIAAIYNWRSQNHVDRVGCEMAKRERIYADFVMHASNSLLFAYVHDDVELRGDEHRLVGLLNQMRLFAPPKVVHSAEAVLRSIIEISLKPKMEIRELATEALHRNPEPDPLLAFSEVCRADLDGVRRRRV